MKRSPLKTKPKIGSLVQEGEWKVKFVGFRSKQAKKDERFARQFHSREFVEWMQAKPCCCGECGGLSGGFAGRRREVHHVKSRGAGGSWKDTVPLSWACHGELHTRGQKTYCQARGWPLERLSELAAGYAAEWEAICRT